MTVAENLKAPVKIPLFNLLMMMLAVALVTGCSSSTGNDDDNKNTREKTFDLVLSSNGSTKVGTITTAEITEGDDAYIEDGFFITISVSDSDFEPPFDVNFVDSDSHCGTFNVQPGEKGEMPCNYDDFLDDPSELTVTADDGDGDDARPDPS